MAGNAPGGSGFQLGNKVPLLNGVQGVGLPLKTLSLHPSPFLHGHWEELPLE